MTNAFLFDTSEESNAPEDAAAVANGKRSTAKNSKGKSAAKKPVVPKHSTDLTDDDLRDIIAGDDPFLAAEAEEILKARGVATKVAVRRHDPSQYLYVEPGTLLPHLEDDDDSIYDIRRDGPFGEFAKQQLGG
ncbi:hypothetical protein [Kordiimonas sp.]|uniref:hypothetical protein n=1 Tax=Kordiimonas sp. TaxID=1970157 RepID=UPI003A94D034